MPWPKVAIKLFVIASKVFGSLGLPHLLPIRKKQPLPVKIVKWYFVFAILPALIFLDAMSPAAIVIGAVGSVLGAWALIVILRDWRSMLVEAESATLFDRRTVTPPQRRDR